MKYILLIICLMSLGGNLYLWNFLESQENEISYLESRYDIKYADVKNLIEITQERISPLTIEDLVEYLHTNDLNYEKHAYDHIPEYVYVLVGELTFRFNQKGVFLSVVHNKL